jgi:hypothetical protein
MTGEALTTEKQVALRWRKKPVVIEAVRITAADYSGHGFDFDGLPFTSAPEWIIDAIGTGALKIQPDDRDYAMWAIKTLEGTMIAGPDDWIIRGVKGEIYPCKPDIFEATYEPA